MKTVEALTLAMAAIESSGRAMPDEDVKAALRVLRTTRRGELEKQDAWAKLKIKD